MSETQYSKSGVNIDAGQQAVALMKAAVEATYTPQVLSRTGNFGGLFAADTLRSMNAPILVASTDGVGTKTRVAARLNHWDSIGIDLVHHCINDILVQGARPLFFLDYVASSKLIPQQVAAIVTGMATACKGAGCALLGGETAEMPGVYEAGEVDVVGTIVGVVDRSDLVDGKQVAPGDFIVGLPSSGLHTNGYSLARHALRDEDWTTHHDVLGMSIGEALLTPHRCYLPEVAALQAAGVALRGLAHITGGGIVDNLPRILPDGVNAVIRRSAWDVPPLFNLIQRLGNVSTQEMLRVFNMGLGMLLVIHADDVPLVQKALPEALLVGRIVQGQGGVSFEE